jgi:hypothetical protein
MHIELSYPYEHDITTVMALFMDRDYLEKKYSAIGPGPVEFVEYAQEDHLFRVAIQRELPGISAEKVPRVARRFVRDAYTLALAVQWQLDNEREAKTGSMDMRVQDVPVKIKADMGLHPQQGGCVQEFQVDIRSSIPVIGNKVETEAAKLVRRSLDKEHTFSQEYLKTYGKTR